MKTVLKIRLVAAILAPAIAVSCEPLFNDVYFPKDHQKIAAEHTSHVDSSSIGDTVPTLVASSTGDSVNDVEPESSYQPSYIDSAYFSSNNIYFPLDMGRIEHWTYGQNVEGILIFQGWYDQPENNDPSIIKQKTSKLVLFFSTEVQPGTYDIIPIPSIWQDWVYVDILTPNTYRYMLPAGKCIGYFTVGTDVPTNEWFFWDSVYMSRLKEFTSGQVMIEKVNQMYRIEISGLDKNSTEVVLYYNGTLNTHSVSWLGVVDPNFWLPHHTSSL